MFLSRYAAACLALSYFEEARSRRIVGASTAHTDFSAVLAMPARDLACLLKIDLLWAQEFITWRKSWSTSEVRKYLELREIKIVVQDDCHYPVCLKNIPDPPIILYYLGEMAPSASNLTVVGSRQASPYGLRATKELLVPVTRVGINIISGLAVGIDTAAHQAALASRGRTWAVLGSGLTTIYPQTNIGLATQIIKTGGGIISEFPPFAPPRPKNFPRRNRLLSGLSSATLVVEANLKSGSLITARYALEQGRDVYAVPGSIFSPTSLGSNKLIAAGAATVTGPSDLLNNLI